MSEGFFYLPQTPIKPLAAPWIRTLAQYDVARKIMQYQKTDVTAYRYIDDTSLQVARLMDYLRGDVYQKRSTKNLGRAYVQACKHPISSQNHITKKALEDGKLSAKKILQHHIQTQQKQFARLGFEYGHIIWESDLLHSINDTFTHLQTLDQILDYQDEGGCLFLDQTLHDISLTTLQNKTGVSFLAKYLHVVRLLSARHNKITIQVLLEDHHPTEILKTFIKESHINTSWMKCARVTLAGKSLSSRKGGWENFTFEKIMQRFTSYQDQVIALGVRLYCLGKTTPQKPFDFTITDLEASIVHAQKAIDFLLKFCSIHAPTLLRGSIKVENILTDPRTAYHPQLIAQTFLKIGRRIQKTQASSASSVQEDVADLIRLAKILGTGDLLP